MLPADILIVPWSWQIDTTSVLCDNFSRKKNFRLCLSCLGIAVSTFIIECVIINLCHQGQIKMWQEKQFHTGVTYMWSYKT